MDQIFPVGKKNKKATINPINKKDNKCFQYAVIITLNHEEMKKISAKKITKIKPSNILNLHIIKP